MHWTRATETAGDIAQRWTAEAGPGGAILLFDADQIRAEACGGLAHLELGLPFTTDTAVRYASISKHFLAALLLRLADRIRLNDLLGDHLAGLKPALAAVSVGHALDMTSGIPDLMETAWLLGTPITAQMDRGALLRFASTLDALNFATGSEISYTNTGYRLIQAALAAKDTDLRRAYRDHFFSPLDLAIHLPEDQADPVPNLAPGYWKSGERGWLRGLYGMHFSASGGLAGSARDLARWLQALLADRGPAAGLLPRLSARRHLADGRATDYGLGLAWSAIGNRDLVGHGGSLPGYKNHFLLDPGLQCGVVVLTNREDTDAHGLALQVMSALLGTPLAPPAPDLLPEGLFVAETGPCWLRHQAGTATFLGADQALFDGGDGWAVSRSAHFPMRLRRSGNGIAGEIGHATRRFQPAPANPTLSAEWNGTWTAPTHNARLTIESGQLTTGTGPLQTTLRLTPITPTHALTERSEGPWHQSASLTLTNATLHLTTNRSRILRFTRA